MSRVLIAYFSATGTTKSAACAIAKAADADLFAIEPKVPYTNADLNWNDRNSRSTKEMNDSSCRPEIKKMPNLDNYDIIFLGFPIWWYQEPRIILSFLESADFSGKTIIPFATSGGSGTTRAEISLKTACPSAVFKPGKLVNYGAAAWASEVMSKLNLKA